MVGVEDVKGGVGWKLGAAEVCGKSRPAKRRTGASNVIAAVKAVSCDVVCPVWVQSKPVASVSSDWTLHANKVIH